MDIKLVYADVKKQVKIKMQVNVNTLLLLSACINIGLFSVCLMNIFFFQIFKFVYISRSADPMWFCVTD